MHIIRRGGPLQTFRHDICQGDAQRGPRGEAHQNLHKIDHPRVPQPRATDEIRCEQEVAGVALTHAQEYGRIIMGKGKKKRKKR